MTLLLLMNGAAIALQEYLNVPPKKKDSTYIIMLIISAIMGYMCWNLKGF